MVSTGNQESVEQEAAFDLVHADTLRFFPDLVRELGGDPAQLLLELGLDSGFLSNGQPAGYRVIANLMEHAAARLRCPDLGLRLATLQGGGSVPSRRRVFVGHDILVDRLPIKRQAIEQFLLLAHLNAVEITGGKARVREARFRFQPLSSPSIYRRYFGCDVRFDQSLDGVVFSDIDFNCPTINPDPQLHSKATSFIDSHFLRRKPPIRAQVRAVILQFIETTDCNKERVAAELHMHPRTLHRRLSVEGTCFEKIKDGVRRDVALGYLRATGLSLQRIAEKVGYAEHSVLTRSCSRWFAASPREVRRNGHG
jgi:AraC-like DNA-binding protein